MNKVIEDLLRKPNSTIPFDRFYNEIHWGVEVLGKQLVWACKSNLGLIGELWILPLTLTYSRPANDVYPYGYYEILNGEHNWHGFKIDCRDVITIQRGEDIIEKLRVKLEEMMK